MLRQPLAGLLLLFVTVVGAFATHHDQSVSWTEAGHLLQTAAPRRLDPVAAAQARAEWEEILRSAEVRLMALERIQEDPAATPGIIQGSTGQQVLNRSRPLTPSTGLESPVPKLSPLAQRADDGGPARTARKSSAKDLASNRAKSAEPWTYNFGSVR